MSKDRQVTGRLQATLDDMKRRLDEEREAAELLTRRLSIHRDPKGQTSTVVSRYGSVESELTQAHRQLNEQKANTEKWIAQITAERDAGRARLREAELRIQTLQEELCLAKAKMEEQRIAAEGLIQQVMAQQNTSAPAPELENRVRELEQELTAARQQFEEHQQAAEQKRQAAEAQIQALSAERDRIAAEIAGAQARATALEEELARARSEFEEQRSTLQAEMLEIAMERDAIRSQYSEVESRTQLLEKEFSAAHDLFRQQREAALQVIQQLETERDQSRARLEDLEEVALKLEEELTKTRADLRAESGKVEITKEVRSGILDAVVDIQIKGQKLLDLLQAWSAKDADLNLEEVSETVNFFERTR